MNLNPHAGIPISIGLLACLIGTIALAALTRPIDRERLAREPSEVIGLLRARHNGPAPCLRWGDPVAAAPSPELEADLHRAGFAADLHSVLPLMSAIRVANHDSEQTQHEATPAQEFREAALSGLGRLDQLRVQSGRQDPEAFVPALGAFAEAESRIQRDRRRVFAFRSTLPPDHRDSFERLVESWRGPLAHTDTQAAAIEQVAMRVTAERIGSLRALLAGYHETYGAYPANFKELLESIPKLPGAVARGLERDGSLRDGWLRSFEYFRLGHNSYRLRSQGSDAGTDVDDVVAHPR